MESKSDSRGEEPRQQGRKPYERRTRQQKQKLEEYFRMDQHPSDKRRRMIAREVGLSPSRVKFWFQNKRTQTRNKSVKTVNDQLNSEVESLRKEIERLMEALNTAACTRCGGSTVGDLTMVYRVELAKLRATVAQQRTEIALLSAEVTKLKLKEKYGGDRCTPSSPSSDQPPSPAEAGPSNLGIPSFTAQTAVSNSEAPSLVSQMQPDQMGRNNIFTEAGTSSTAAAAAAAATTGASNGDVLLRYAENAAAELQAVAEGSEPLWVTAAGSNNAVEFLNEEAYTERFLRWEVPSPLGWRREATRGVAVINMDARDMIEILCDVKKWSALFTNIVLRATTVEVHSTGRDYDGALQTISAEYHLPSPLVPVREATFLRYCKKLPPACLSWVVVDFTLGALHGGLSNGLLKRPSGCVISKMDDKLLKVTWVENMEVDTSYVNVMSKPFVESGAAFGASRWLAALDRQSISLANAQRENQTATQLKNILKLAERLLSTFHAGVACSAAYGWVYESGNGTSALRVASRRNAEDPEMPVGVVLCATISFWVAAPPRRIFDFLCNERNRAVWDPLTENGILEEQIEVPTGNDRGNRISLHKLHGNPNIFADNKTTFIQETRFEEACSYLAYAPVDTEAMNMCMYGGGPERVPLVASGFSIAPDGPKWMVHGSMVTASYQIRVDPDPTADIVPACFEVVKDLVMTVVVKIKNAVQIKP